VNLRVPDLRDPHQRTEAPIGLMPGDLEQLVAPVFRRSAIDHVEQLRAGLVNTNFKLTMRGHPDPILLRLYHRGSSAASKEVELLRRMRGRVPVPEVAYFVRTNPVTGHPCALLQWIDGQRLDHLELEGGRELATGQALGKALAAVHAIKFPRFGFLDGAIEIASAVELDRDGMLAYLDGSFTRGPGAVRLGGKLSAALRSFITREGHRVSEWPGPPCLVHGDFNGSNVLFRAFPEEPVLAAILDWEFALAGRPAFDFAHLLRPPLDRFPDLADAAAQSYREAGELLPRNWREIARITDLFAWIEILNRTHVTPRTVDTARRFIGTTIAEAR
jgi:aminoglycoside phosphotransferase (APT) family kinase protein